MWEKLVERDIIIKELPTEVVIPNKIIEAIAKYGMDYADLTYQDFKAFTKRRLTTVSSDA